MAESHIISGLVKKRGEIKGEIEYLTSKINTLKSNLNTIDKAILLFEPEYQIDSIKTIHKNRVRYFNNGEFKSLLLTILKSSGEALETQEIISHLVDLKSITFSSHQEQLKFKSVILKQLKHYTEQNLLTHRVGGRNIHYWDIKPLDRDEI